MIKRIRFATRPADLSPEAFAPEWRDAVAAVAAAPPEVRPRRIVVCTAMHDLIADPEHDGIDFEWFDDDEHLGRCDDWVAGDGGAAAGVATSVVLVDEHVMRGADRLERRRKEGASSFVHLAVARRADGLTLEQFLERWAAKAGKVRRDGDEAPTAIPDEVRGLAYVQNRPRPRTEGDWAYDAINEVHFDDVAGLVARIDWFREHVGERPDPDLFSANWFIAARADEVPLGLRPR